MIIRKRGHVEINSLFPNTDWYNEGNYVIDETKEENKELIQKVKTYAPYMDLVIENEQIVDVIPIEKHKESVHIENDPVDDEKAFLSEAVVQLSDQIESLKQEIQTLKGGN